VRRRGAALLGGLLFLLGLPVTGPAAPALAAGCGTLTVGSFGDLTAAQLAQGELTPGTTACRTIDAAAGAHVVRLVESTTISQITWALTGPGGYTCESTTVPVECDLPSAGTYTLNLSSPDHFDAPSAYTAALIRLNSDDGCAPAVGTSWATPDVTFQPATGVEILCQPITTTPGERVVVASTGDRHWFADAAADPVCGRPQYFVPEDGCVLPGAGPYRILSEAAGTAPITVRIGGLTAPVGCPVVEPARFGTVPGPVAGGIRCRALHVPAAGRYLVGAVGTDYAKQSHDLYAPDGTRTCIAAEICDLRAGTHTLVARSAWNRWDEQFRTVFVPVTAAGCEPVSDQGLTTGAHRAAFSGPGQTHCLALPSPAGAVVSLIRPPRTDGPEPSARLIDATGAVVGCGTAACTLRGPAPYRLLLAPVRGAVDGDHTAAYGLAAQRIDRDTDCPVLPAGTDGATVTTTADRIAACYTVTGTGALTTLAFTRTAGTAGAALNVLDAAGAVVCGQPFTAGQVYAERVVRCRLAAAEDYTVMLRVAAVGSTYRVTRTDDTPACHLGSVSPTALPNDRAATVVLTGAGFGSSDRIQLTRAGASPIQAQVLTVGTGGASVTVRADVTGVAPGAWDVVATSGLRPVTVTLAGGITVRAARLGVVRAPSISGTARVGGTVRVAQGTWSPAPGSYGYQWAAGGVAIKGATGAAYVIPAALRGKRLTVTVTARRAHRADTPVSSAAVTVGYGAAPRATARPKIIGTARAGKTVKVSAGVWSPGATSYRYEWRVNGKLVATSASLKLKKAWAGKKLTVTVIAKRTGHYDGRATSGTVKIKK
jgi:hypothetical protein